MAGVVVSVGGVRGRLGATATAVVAALVAAGIVLAAEAPRRPSAPQTYVIPPGTADRVRAGESIADVMPQTVSTGVGVPLIVENLDTENHAFGPFALAPGQRWRRQFAAAGTYGFSCSIYPTAGFTIQVAPAGHMGVADAVRRAWLSAWAVAGLALAAALAGRLAASGEPGAASDATAEAPSRDALMRVLAGGWTGAAIGLLPLGLVASTRVADWGPALTSRATIWQVGGALVAVGGVLAVRRRRSTAGSGSAALAMMGAVLAATWFALVPDIGLPGGWRAALAVVGAGCLIASVRTRLRSEGRPESLRLALAGAILVLGAVPMPRATPPATAALALPVLAAAVAVAILGWLGGRRFRLGADHGGLVRLAAGAVALAQLVVLWGALIAHVDAVALPLDGNPVPASAASLERGAAIWAVDCASCHPSAADVALSVRDADDRTLLELLTSGQGDMPGFAYALDITARGDVLNFLRRGTVGGR